jgi:hypothetical protein
MDVNVDWNQILWIALWIVFLLIIWGLFGFQKWKVWAAHQSGLADLVRDHLSCFSGISAWGGRYQGDCRVSLEAGSVVGVVGDDAERGEK